MTRIPLLIAALLSLACVTARADDAAAKRAPVKTIDVAAFEKMAAEPDVVILDVRTPAEHATGFVKGAVLIDYKSKDFAQRIAELDKGKTYLVYCAVGIRSESACKKLDQLEFPKAYNLTGGMKAWQKAGKPVEKPAK